MYWEGESVDATQEKFPVSAIARGLIVRVEMNVDCRLEAGVMAILLSVVLGVH
jgi:hypothetical protein